MRLEILTKETSHAAHSLFIHKVAHSYFLKDNFPISQPLDFRNASRMSELGN